MKLRKAIAKVCIELGDTLYYRHRKRLLSFLCYNLAIKLSSALACYIKGMIYFEIGEYHLAIKWWQIALDKGYNNADISILTLEDYLSKYE
jgi:tetratricopeptide (TPR) repeat protein